MILNISRLQIHSESLDIVYNPAAVRWMIEFFTKPHQSSDPSFTVAARHGYNTMKQRTKQELLRNWDNILQGHLVEYFVLKVLILSVLSKLYFVTM